MLAKLPKNGMLAILPMADVLSSNVIKGTQ